MFKSIFPGSYRGAALAATVSASVLLLMGCGGSGNDSPDPVVSPSPTASTRAAAIDTVRSARSASSLFDSPGSAFGRKADTGSAGMALAKRVIRYAQKNKAGVTRQVGLQLDEESGLYFRFTQTDNGFRLSYFEDAAGAKPAGSLEFKSVEDDVVEMIFDMPKGKDPMVGTLTLVSTDEAGTSGMMKGDLTDPVSQEKISFNLRFTPGATEESLNITGTLSATDADGTVTFKNIVGKSDGSMSADIEWNGMAGKLTGVADGSGTLTLGALRAEWNAEGNGKLILANGTVVNIADFDTATGEG